MDICFKNGWRAQLDDDEPSLYNGKGWKSPNIHLNKWLEFQKLNHLIFSIFFGTLLGGSEKRVGRCLYLGTTPHTVTVTNKGLVQDSLLNM